MSVVSHPRKGDPKSVAHPTVCVDYRPRAFGSKEGSRSDNNNIERANQALANGMTAARMSVSELLSDRSKGLTNAARQMDSWMYHEGQRLPGSYTSSIQDTTKL